MPVYFTDGRKGLTLISKDYEGAYMMHYRTPGSKNGKRLYQYKDGSLTPLGRIHYGVGQKRKSNQTYKESDTVFVSGKVKYDKPLSGKIKREVKNIIKANSKIVIGDAPGADTRVQEYLKKKNYQNVEVFTTDTEARNNVGGWKVNKIDASKYSDEREARAQKDIAMTKNSNKGLAISSEDDRPDSATSKNIQRMRDQGSSMVVYDYKTNKFVNDLKEKGQILVLGDKEYSVKDLLKKDTDKELLDNYDRARKEAGKIGGENGDKRVAYVDSLPDGPEKTKEIEKFLEDSDNYLCRHHEIFAENRKDGFSWSDANRIRNIKDSLDPKSYEINATDHWLFNQILSKSGDWYNTTGKSKGFKKIANEINDLQEEQGRLYNKIVADSKTGSYNTRAEQYKNDPRVKQINRRIDELTEQMPEQVLKDLNVPVTQKNLERIRPFVFWD